MHGCIQPSLAHQSKTSLAGGLLAVMVLLAFLAGCSQEAEKAEPKADSPATVAQSNTPPVPAEQPIPIQQQPQMAPLGQPSAPGQIPPPENAPSQYQPRTFARQNVESTAPRQRLAAPAPNQLQQPQAIPLKAQQAQPQFAPQMMQPEAMQAPPEFARSQPMAESSLAKQMPESKSEDPFDVVEVFYGTDRAPVVWPSGVLPHKFHALLPAVTCGLLGIAVALVLTRFKQYIISGLTLLVALSGAVVVGQEGWVQYQKFDRFLSNESIVYGKQQGEMQLGLCRVSIPKSHQTGSLESPSVIHWEFEEKPEDHVMLMEVKSKEEKEFFDMLRQRAAESPHNDLLIFIHGYNVTFEDAARRTAQIAHDLEFQGAPVFFSWPSQGELLGYVTDRSNSFWTASHLKDFLLKVHQQSGAQSIHLIAHSMGNRAFGAAIESLAADLDQNQKVFNEVILAAPDVDARVFTEEIAPKLTGMSQHVTLYASQNDLALKASRAVNGYPRAGDVGANILILNGIDTIDVTKIDTSLLGHAYYGDNKSVISDIYALMQKARSPRERKWLLDMAGPSGMYWYFDPQYNVMTQNPNAPPVR
ncbi:alpha/beta hydrolase [Bremerella cremea]|uniref:Alpha/beta hydrolase n=1 Tax=Bremerella cremea TaxID=1031537 RepID=A0A368KSE9_9BACT|nr:alpha/beta hydrolase [Bremerella cremea]RCS47644.1 alpha/beta hydrolase [Bremerella cremea]